MDRKFLYTLIAILGVAVGLVYIQKKHPEFGIFGKNTQQTDGWQKQDPGWIKESIPTPPTPTPPTPPLEEPRVEPVPPTPPTQPQPKQQPKRLQPQNPGPRP